MCLIVATNREFIAIYTRSIMFEIFGQCMVAYRMYSGRAAHICKHHALLQIQPNVKIQTIHHHGLLACCRPCLKITMGRVTIHGVRYIMVIFGPWPNKRVLDTRSCGVKLNYISTFPSGILLGPGLFHLHSIWCEK